VDGVTMAKQHVIKIWPEYYEQTVSGNKPWEYRKNDRDYQTGDTVIMREYHQVKGYTGNKIYANIGYLYHCGNGYVIFTVEDIKIKDRAEDYG
jgi:hypothetical protein